MQQYRYRGFIRGLIAVGLLASLVSLTDKAQAASGNGPYYAEPSWSQKLPAATRFVVLTDWNSEAVLDRETGLVWEKSSRLPGRSWNEIKFDCLDKNVGGRTGWRLPAIAELLSLVDRTVQPPGPTLPSDHPFNVPPAIYWSATTHADVPTSAWVVDLSTGAIGVDSKTLSRRGWCVRGGMNADQY